MEGAYLGARIPNKDESAGFLFLLFRGLADLPLGGNLEV